MGVRIFYKRGLIRHPLLAKIKVFNQAICLKLQVFRLHDQSIFVKITCILHHFAFLFWLPTRVFSTPITHFQPLKPHFLMAILPFLALFLMVRKGFIYTIAAYFYAFRLVFCSILHCVQHHFTLRLAPKRTAFSTKTHCVQRHIALRFAANCTTFSRKQPQVWCKWRSFQINIHFSAFTC